MHTRSLSRMLRSLIVMQVIAVVLFVLGMLWMVILVSACLMDAVLDNAIQYMEGQLLSFSFDEYY